MRTLTVLFTFVTLAGSVVLAQDNKEASPFYNQAKPFLSDRHVARGLECSACHGDAEKKGPVAQDKCLTCHTSFGEVANATKDVTPNPHANHLVESGDLECTSCHHGHKPSEIFCHSCHADMKFERQAAK
jgi:fumarate reductase flavoprotein subunit